MYNDKYIKAEINLYDTNLCGNKTPIEGEHYACFSIALLHSVVNVDKKYHLQISLNESKYALKKR